MRALVIKHVRREGPGTLGAFLAGRGVDLDIREMEGGDPLPVNLDGCGLLIVMGGPMNVDEEAAFPFLSGEIELIQEAIERDVPMLGICLGSQLLCKAAGGRVTANAAKEIGWYDVDLTPEGEGTPCLRTPGNVSGFSVARRYFLDSCGRGEPCRFSRLRPPGTARRQTRLRLAVSRGSGRADDPRMDRGGGRTNWRFSRPPSRLTRFSAKCPFALRASRPSPPSSTKTSGRFFP